jgi:hypothetical protein
LFKSAFYGLDMELEPEPELVKVATGTVKNNYGSAKMFKVLGPMRNEGGREDGKCSEYAWDRGDVRPFVF